MTFDPSKHIVHVPFLSHIEPETDRCLRGLESLGVRVDRLKGASAIDLVRNLAASNALRDGFESLMFIDSDMMFDPADALKLLKSDVPVIAGVYAAKVLGSGQINVNFTPEVETIRFGPWADRLYPVRGVGAGFLRIKTAVLLWIIDGLNLPECRMSDRYGWPFFQPLIAEQDGEIRYFCEDYAFCQRCLKIGITPMADTSFRLYHLGIYTYGWEEAGGEYVKRHRNLESPYSMARPTVPKHEKSPVSLG